MFKVKSNFWIALPLAVIQICAVLTPYAKASYQDVSLIFKDGQGDPIHVALDLRISLWDTYDVKTGEIDGEGSINTSARHYGQYQTSYTITPDEGGHLVSSDAPDGYYEFYSKNLPGFPTAIGCYNAYLQLEYKYPGEPNTAYRIYDFMDDPPFQNVSRLLIDPNSTYYTLDAGPRTNWNTFTIDANSNAPTAIKLEFGETLGESLKWSIANVRFELSDDLYIDGSLELAGGLDFNLSEAKEMRLENLASAPTCDSASKGRLYYNANDNLPYYCNGSGWNQL